MAAEGRNDVLIRRNDYSVLAPPDIGQWQPELTVSVVIPAHNHQDKLDLVLAALAAQTYPDHLTEVVIVDDNSTPPLTLPPITPTNTRLITSDPHGWGSAHAVNTGAKHTTGTVILRLDADMLTYHHHIEAHMRWHHQCDYTAVIGHKRFTNHTPHTHTPQHIHHTVTRRKTAELFSGERHEAQWIENVIDTTDGLRAADYTEAYRVFVGASGSVHRTMFDTVGGMDPTMPLGGDTEFAYRLAQAGTVFIPDNTTSAWHLGRSQIQSRRKTAKRYRRPFQAHRVPGLNYRNTELHRWEVPVADVVVAVDDATLEDVHRIVGPLLSEPDVRVGLVADWPDPHQRHATLDDPHVEHRLIHETYRHDQRIHFTNTTPPQQPHTPYRLHLPATAATTGRTLSVLTATADRLQVGLLEIRLDDGTTVRLERTAAFARARHVGGDDVDKLVERCHGVHRIDASSAAGADVDVVDCLSTTRYRHVADPSGRVASARRDLAEARRDLAAAKRRVVGQRRRIDRLQRSRLWRLRRFVDRRAKRLLPHRGYRLLRRVTGG